MLKKNNRDKLLQTGVTILEEVVKEVFSEKPTLEEKVEWN